MRILFFFNALVIGLLYSSISYSSNFIWGVSRPPISSNDSQYTYIKCVYKKTTSSEIAPTSSWVWGVDPKDENKYAIVYGNWFSGNIINNLFFTSATNSEIKNVCISTLKQKNIKTDTVIPYASDHYLSYYYPFWNDSEKESINNKKFDKIVVFGDSLSDTINIYNKFYGTIPNHNSWFLGHFSNGKIWHEYLSDLVSLPSSSWAVGNAESGEKKFFPGLKRQLESFIKYFNFAANYKIRKTIFFTLFGGNDLISGEKNALDIISNYKKELPRLANLGANYIVIMNLPDLTATPKVKDWTSVKKRKLKENIDLFNNELVLMIASFKVNYPRTKWVILDLHSLFKTILTDHEVKESCLKISDSSFSYLKQNEINMRCYMNYKNYVFWDNMHPTTIIHSEIAKFIANKLKEDSMLN